MDEAKKAAYVKAITQAFDRVAYDLLQAAPNNSMTASEAQEVTADYVEAPGWWDLEPEERAECLREAIPYDQCL